MNIERSGGVRLVLDTNTVVSGLVWGGVPGQLIDAAVAAKVHLIASLPLLDELQAVLFRKKFAGQFAARKQSPALCSRAMRHSCNSSFR
jgi:putative PIN family toxin of toxin-antitoxin system